jgi:hypothetical protein
MNKPAAIYARVWNTSRGAIGKSRVGLRASAFEPRWPNWCSTYGALARLFWLLRNANVLFGLIRWVRLRLRAALWRQWKTPRRSRAALLEPGVRPRLASNTAGSGRGPWYLA